MTSINAIEMTGIVKRFGAVTAANRVDFCVRRGEIHALLGENGAGKSTLMSVLFGLYRPDEGGIQIDGNPVRFRSPQDSATAGIGMVHQNFRLVSTLTALDNIVLGASEGMWRGRRWHRDKAEQIVALAEQFGLRFPIDRPIWQMSVGEQQRVEIFKALYRNSSIIILDEPTSVLTPQEADDLYATLAQLKASGKTVVVTTHKLKEVMNACDTISIMRKGRMVKTLPRSETTEQQLAGMLMGDEPITKASSAPRKKGRCLLDLQEVKALGDHGQLALRELSLEVHEGEIVGIAGVAGNGQKELAEIITGMRNWTGGAMKFAGEWVQRPNIRRMIDLGVAHVPEDRMRTGMAGSLALADNLLMKTFRDRDRSRFGLMLDAKNKLWAESLAAQYQVATPSLDTPVRQLSGGNQQKLLLAREIESHPRLLVAMHPTQGLDVGATEYVHHLLLKLRDNNAGVLLISEDLDEVLKLSDRVLVIYNGRITGEVTSDKASREEIGLRMTGSTQRKYEVPVA